jgi:hypothetical protein
MTDTCGTCGKPIYWVDGENQWYHEDLNDILTCPATEVGPPEFAEV